MNQRLLIACLCSTGLAVWTAHGQEMAPAPQLEVPQAPPLNQFSLGFRMGFNIQASFKTAFGSGAAIPAPGVHGVNRNYDDGYNRVDDTGNAGGYTRYWGYDYNSQYDPGANTITMHSAAGSASTGNRGDELLPGFELSYQRELGRQGRWHWGLETALNYQRLSIRDNSSTAINGVLTSDTYQMPPVPGGGYVIPPPAPYQGQPGSSGNGNPAIYDTPSSRSTSPLAATVGGSRSFDADIFGWRVGPRLEIALSDNVSLAISGGFSLVGVASDFSVNQVVSYYEPGSGVDQINTPIKGAGSHSELLMGGYVSGQASVALAREWRAFAGVQFQDVGSYTQKLGSSAARLDLSQSLFVSFGATYSF